MLCRAWQAGTLAVRCHLLTTPESSPSLSTLVIVRRYPPFMFLAGRHAPLAPPRLPRQRRSHLRRRELAAKAVYGRDREPRSGHGRSPNHLLYRGRKEVAVQTHCRLNEGLL